jgi:hypothetical protein
VAYDIYNQLAIAFSMVLLFSSKFVFNLIGTLGVFESNFEEEHPCDCGRLQYNSKLLNPKINHKVPSKPFRHHQMQKKALLACEPYPLL